MAQGYTCKCSARVTFDVPCMVVGFMWKKYHRKYSVIASFVLSSIWKQLCLDTEHKRIAIKQEKWIQSQHPPGPLDRRHRRMAIPLLKKRTDLRCVLPQRWGGIAPLGREDQSVKWALKTLVCLLQTGVLTRSSCVTTSLGPKWLWMVHSILPPSTQKDPPSF